MLTVAFLWTLRSGAAADQRARIAEAKVDSLEAFRVLLEERSRNDSAALASEQVLALQREKDLSAARAQTRLEASRAALAARGADVSLRSLIDSLGGSTVALDTLEAAHAAEIAAKDQEIAQADSLSAVRLSLLQATEKALESERAAHQATSAVVGAQAVEISALKSGRRRDRIRDGIVVLAVAGILYLR